MVASIFAVATPRPAFAVLLAEDLFLTGGPGYTIDSLSGQNPDTSGFTGAWFTSNGSSPTVSTPSLSYGDPNYPAPTGAKILSPTANSRVHRLLDPATNPFESTDTGTVYLSLLLQTGANNGYRAFEMHNGGNDDAANRTLQIGVSSFGDFPSNSEFGFRVNNNSSLEFNLGTEDLDVHLFLVRFDLSTTDDADTIRIWNNPDISNLASDPPGGVLATGFNFAADRLGAGYFSGTQYAFDELRIGTTLTDVLTNVLTCDINGNGICNSSDIAILTQNMFQPGTYEDGDIDQSGFIDQLDFRLFKDHPARTLGYDLSEGFAATAPEPAAAVLFLLAALCVRGAGRTRHTRRLAVMLVVVTALLSGSSTAIAAEEDLLNDTINFSGATLNLRPWTQLPDGFTNIISMTTRPDDGRMYVTAQEGTIFAVNENANGSTTPVSWFNAASALQTATGRSMNGTGGQRGLQSVAFHPDFGDSTTPGYGKLYTTMLEDRPSNPDDPSFFYLGNSTYGGGGGDGVLAEWTYNHATGQVAPSSYRELFRVNMPNFDHPIKQAKFNPYARPGDEDYGLLYMTQGDSNDQDSLNDDPQDRGDVLGKMIRINPLQSGADRYTIPATNPFASSSDPNVLKEVYAYGFRNPHTFSFNPDAQGDIAILVGDIGRDNIEEVNLVKPGHNYGWTKREGTFVHHQQIAPHPDTGYIDGVDPLPANEATVGIDSYGTRYTYPVAQWDHNGVDVEVGADWWTGNSIASSFVIQNGSDPALDNQFIHLNFASNHGDVYHNDFDDMLGAVTQLDPTDPSRDHPSELTQATLQRLHLTLDDDNNPLTPPIESDNFNTLLGAFRNDGRFGEGISGEMFISNKNNRTIYLVTNTVPDDRLTLIVDRGTGQMTITNATGSDIAIDRVSLFSPSGSLAPTELETLGGGWAVTGANSSKALNQWDALGSLNVTGATMASLGDAYEGQLVAFDEPVGNDVQFVYWTDGPTGRSFAGEVVYTGESAIPNTIVLTVDVTTGEAVMLNETPFSQQVELYTVSSPSGSLNPAGWDTFESQGINDGDWLASPPQETRLTELQEDGTTTFDNATPYNIGHIFNSVSDPDLVFEFLLAGESALREGIVDYVLPGDYDDNGVVDAADYTIWRDNLGGSGAVLANRDPGNSGNINQDDYMYWKANFGKVWPASGSGSGNSNGRGAVPEPSTALQAAFVWITAVASCRRRGFLGTDK